MTANDNRKGQIMGQPPIQEDPMDSLIGSIQAMHISLGHQTQCLKLHHQVLADHEQRIQALEILLLEE